MISMLHNTMQLHCSSRVAPICHNCISMSPKRAPSMTPSHCSSCQHPTQLVFPPLNTLLSLGFYKKPLQDFLCLFNYSFSIPFAVLHLNSKAVCFCRLSSLSIHFLRDLLPKLALITEMYISWQLPELYLRWDLFFELQTQISNCPLDISFSASSVNPNRHTDWLIWFTFLHLQ